ncbi:MAG TPA: hypothetical protein P5048_03565 [Chlamydiales bacterium]|nr:hypothetical protein [Chlamydiales bacterium]
MTVLSRIERKYFGEKIPSVFQRFDDPVEMARSITQCFQNKLANYEWLEACLQKKSASFPYEVTGLSVKSEDILSQESMSLDVLTDAERYTSFVVNIPIGVSIFDLKKDPQDYSYPHSRLEQMMNETGFDEQEQAIAKKHLAVIVGYNLIDSVDSIDRIRFKRMIRNVQLTENIYFSVFGFFWTVSYEKKPGIQAVYDCKKSFLILKHLDCKASLEVKKHLYENLSDYVDFHQLRQRIYAHSSTKTAMNKLKTQYPQDPVYFTTLDSDVLDLKSYFSRVHEYVQRVEPSIISLGYDVSIEEHPIIRFGIYLDMKVREVMNNTVPYSAYFPEPATSFRICKASDNLQKMKDHYATLRFKGNRSAKKLESRRFIEYGKDRTIFDSNLVFDEKGGGVVMGTPSRMVTDTIERSPHRLTYAEISNSGILSSLRSISQAHFEPKEWAGEVYNGLDSTCHPYRSAISYMTKIYNIFDPLSRIIKFGQSFDYMIGHYHDELTQKEQEDIRNAVDSLRSLRMSEVDAERVVECAIKTGEVIYQELKYFYDLHHDQSLSDRMSRLDVSVLADGQITHPHFSASYQKAINPIDLRATFEEDANGREIEEELLIDNLQIGSDS